MQDFLEFFTSLSIQIIHQVASLEKAGNQLAKTAQCLIKIAYFVEREAGSVLEQRVYGQLKI